MITLGDIARQAGVRPPLPVTAGSVAADEIPTVREAIPAAVTGGSTGPSGQMASVRNGSKAAERSSSAADLYERAIQQAERASEAEQQPGREYDTRIYSYRIHYPTHIS